MVADRLQGLQKRPSPPSAINNALIWLNPVFLRRTKGAGAHRRLIACRYLRGKGSGVVDRRTPLLIRHRIVSRVIPASKGISEATKQVAAAAAVAVRAARHLFCCPLPLLSGRRPRH